MRRSFTHLTLIISFLLLLFQTQAQWNTDPAVNTAIVTGSFPQQPKYVCSDGAGGMIVIYEDWNSNSSPLISVKAQRINTSGTKLWGTGVSIYVSSFSPEVVVQSDNNGGAIVLISVGSAFDRNVFAQRLDASGNKLWNAGNVVTVCNAADNQNNIRLATFADGSSVAVWQDDRPIGGLTNIFSQKLNANGTVAWATNGVIVNIAVNNQQDPQIIPIVNGGNNECIITWGDFRAAIDNTDIYAQRLDKDGVRQWPGGGDLSGAIICNDASAQNRPLICSDGSTGAIIAWRDQRSTSLVDIYAQRINVTGTPQWTPNGVAVIATPANDELEKLIYNTTGAVAVWKVLEAGGLAFDIKANKINFSGSLQWANGGITICNAPDTQVNPQIETDGNDGNIIVWADRRSVTSTDIYAQRIDVNGNTLWAANGKVVCNAAGLQNSPYLTTNGCNSIFIWMDERNRILPDNNVDVYATSFDCNGNVPITSSVTNVSSDIYIKISPNPVQHQLFIQNKGNNNMIVVTITDVTGKIILAGKQFQQNFTYDMSRLPQGMYMILAEDKKRNIKLHQMIVKQ
jgi:Secretion system C-terminal sorting domain